MRRFIAAVVLGAGLLSGVGCMGRAEYVQKNKDGGIIALKVDADEAEAHKLMEKHLGSNYEVVEKYDPKTRNQTGSDLQPGSKLNVFAPKDDGVMHIVYRKSADSKFGGKTPSGLPPAPKDGGFIQVNRDINGGSPTEFGSVTPPSLIDNR